MQSAYRKVGPVLFFILCICAVTVFILIRTTNVAKATHDTPPTFHDPVEFSGFAWSDTIGWISLNCNQPLAALATDTCGDVPYKVEIVPDTNPADAVLATIEGYAWSENIGWIKFGGLSGFPASLFNNAEIRLDGTNYRVYGWARACAGTINGDCSDMTPHPDGWDGWISLSCENFTNGCAVFDYRLLVNNNALKGYAWGNGGTTPTEGVIGWVDFSFADFLHPCAPSNSCVGASSTVSTNQWCVQSAPVVCPMNLACIPATGSCSWGSATLNSLTIDPILARKGQSTKLNWQVTVSPAGAVDECYAEGTNGDHLNGNGNGVQGTNVSTSILQDEKVTYTIYCVPVLGGTPVALGSAVVNTLPNISET